MKAVRATSSDKMMGFVSTALKYPCPSMLENTRIWRNIAPPMQLKPMLCISSRILLVTPGLIVMVIVTKTNVIAFINS